MFAIEMQDHLHGLEAERAFALEMGFEDGSAYLVELETEIELTREAYIGEAVTEIATLRGELFGPQVG